MLPTRSTALAAALGLLFTAGVARAQISFTGVIEKAPPLTICQQQTHFLTCSGPSPFAASGVLLKSSTLDLNAFVGQNARFTAVPGGLSCSVWDVTAVQVPPPATLEVCGNPVPGCPMRFRVGPTGVIGSYLLFFSTSAAFVPLDPVSGTLLLQPPLHFLASGMTFGASAAVDLVLPADISLTGLSLWFQGARRDIGPIGPLQATNAVCFTILGPSPPCINPGC